MAHIEKFNRAAIGHMLAHYDRGAERIGNECVDRTRSHLNYNLAAELQPKRQGDFIKQRCSEVKVQNRKDVNLMCTWIVTVPKDLPENEHEQFFKTTFDFLSDRYGKENVISAYVHMDETTPHMHFAFIPVVPDKKKQGKFKVSAKERINRFELCSFHFELEQALSTALGHSVGILNGATKDGNKSVTRLKRESQILAQREAERQERVAKTRIQYAEQRQKAADERIETARMQMLKHCLSMKEVQRVNISDLPHISTGIAELDRIIGGFYEGQLVVLSGKRGEGKSTLGSQFILEAVDQGVNSLIFSGELPNYMVKNWIDTQAAGADYLTPIQNITGKEIAVLYDDVRDKIENWYGDNLFIVDDNDVEGDNLLHIIESIIYRKQIKICLIDNLMCFANYDDNIYNNQGKIATRLKKIATNTQCTILLVVHERKQQGKDVSDNVSGSADITNRADVVLRLSRDSENSQGILQVAKNRLFGTLALHENQKHINTTFDELSRRISTDLSENDKKFYGWVQPKDQVIKIDTNDLPADLPF